MKNTSLLIVLLTGFVFITFVIEVSSNCVPEAKEECGEHKQCVKQGENNTYHCVCKEGFTTLEDSCQDLDECQKRDIRTKCKRKGARCKNTPGSYTCKCPRGFVMHLEADYCKDIDECEDEPCHHKAVCQNERGSYTCTCVKGFAGDGHECVEDLAYKQKQKIKQIMTIGGAAGGGTLFLIALIACFLGARKKKPKEEKVEDADSTLTVHSRWESSEESDDDDE